MPSKLSLSDWANLAEIGAAIGVIISLIFVGMELQNNTAATEAATREAINQKDIQYLSLRLDSSVLAQAHAKVESGDDLSELETSQMIHQELINFIAFENSYYQFRKGVLEENEWLRHRNIIRGQIREFPYSQVMWERHGHIFGPEFQALVNGFVSE